MAKNSYREYLKKEFTDMIDTLDIAEPQKQFMKSRWLDQLLWFEGKAGQASKWSNRFRLTNVVGGVTIPALVSLSFNNSPLGDQIDIGWITFGLSQIVAVSAALEEYFGFANKRIEYRKSAELLKSEGWKFLQLTSSYKDYADHKEAYPAFALRVEQYIQEDLQAFMQLAKENADRQKQQQEKQGQSPSPLPGVPNASENPKNVLPTNTKSG